MWYGGKNKEEKLGLNCLRRRKEYGKKQAYWGFRSYDGFLLENLLKCVWRVKKSNDEVLSNIEWASSVNQLGWS